MSRYLIGIDLGTTNSALAFIDTEAAAAQAILPIQLFPVPQLVAPGEVDALPTLPSFLYVPTQDERAAGGLGLPWDPQPAAVVGALARDQGVLMAGRLVASAKSWLCHGAVDRTAKILPWGADLGEAACSPVEASARYLMHLRDAWNHKMAPGASGLAARWERQEIVLTVPASFDAEARELTVEAARQAGAEHLTLLEEPLASFYAWMTAQNGSPARALPQGSLVLVCDVGGGTSDFSLIRVRLAADDLHFERIAIGEHLLLGGDNLDLALARLLEEKLGGPRLTLRQRGALLRQACAAKERLLGDPAEERLPIRLLGGGGAVIGGALGTVLTREEVERTLLEGFLPLIRSSDLPSGETRSGLRELGLPYAGEPAITKHLAAFLGKAATADAPRDSPGAAAGAGSPAVRPDAVLFNGGFFVPALARQRVVDAIAGWYPEERGWRPAVLPSAAPASAVAIGAAHYGQVRRAGGMRVSAGSGRAYYIGVQVDGAPAGGGVPAVCIVPRGCQEGTSLRLPQRAFALRTNQPVAFTLFSSTTRRDAHGDLVRLDEAEMHRHAPLVTVLRYGKRARQAELAVQLAVRSTEVGTLELWCESRESPHRWRLKFQLRGASPSPEPAALGSGAPPAPIAEASLASAERILRAAFATTQAGGAAEGVALGTLPTRLEAVLGAGRDAWPLSAIRALFDVLAEVAEGRRRAPRFEARWLNLAGFCLRPGFGATLDDWRVAQLRKVYLAGLSFPKDIQCQLEWLILWRRVAGGLTAGQQKELYQREGSRLGAAGRKASGRLPAQVEREAWRLVASLEQLPGSVRTELGEHLLSRIGRAPGSQGDLWSLGRLGARIPFSGPINCVVVAAVAEQWLLKLLERRELTPAVASAIVQLGARTEDPGRDISEALRLRALEALAAAGIPDGLLQPLREYVPPARADGLRIFGDSLPEGLRLVG